jgi:hypothetical protein
MDESGPKVKWYCPTPGKLVVGLLVVELCLMMARPYDGWMVFVAVLVLGVAIGIGFLWFLGALLLHWRFQFGISTLALLMVVVAVVSGWVSWKRGNTKRQEEAARAIQECGGEVHFGFWPDSDIMPSWCRSLADAYWVKLNSRQVTDEAIACLNNLTNLESLSLEGTQVTDAGLVYIEGLTKLRHLSLGNTQVSDNGLQHLEGFGSLEELKLYSTDITDAGLVRLQRLANLRELWLDDTSVSDAGLVHLQCLQNLEELWLCGTRVSDLGVVHLEKLTKLRALRVVNTAVSDIGVTELQHALPDCAVSR